MSNDAVQTLYYLPSFSDSSSAVHTEHDREEVLLQLTCNPTNRASMQFGVLSASGVVEEILPASPS